MARFKSNDSIRVDVIPNNRGRKLSKDIPREKHMRRYPGVLIGRLGINVEFGHHGIGTELLDFIKSWFIDEENKTGCRFLIVDAYNKDIPLAFYQKNEFHFLFFSEQQEAENLGYDVSNCFLNYDERNAVSISAESRMQLDRYASNIHPSKGLAETKIGVPQASLLCLVIKSNPKWYNVWDKKVVVEAKEVRLSLFQKRSFLPLSM